MPQPIKLLCAAVLAAITMPAMAQKLGQMPIGAPAVPPSHSVEQADSRLAQVKQDREAVEAQFSAAEQVCYTKFFVNACVDKAKEVRRERLAGLRAIEIEANYFKRKYAVDQRDRELEDRAQQDAAEEAARAAQPAPAPREEPAERAPARPAAVTPVQRQAEHDAKVKRQQAQDAAEAPQRAQNAEDHQRRVEESERRQARVARRLAEKEEKRRRRAEAEAAKQAAIEAARAKAGAR
ncbi:hypothetical protein [Massilia endophytica]|uniref:hypothetical protein n=1 Tax=Massilia endophytica TaxID=2899220 RepID=UPI001E2C1CC8|nr:hypothetical protein [Massilia endophytica]UGQ44900.1 hypothetical protein LSQ66_13945 [Massilia endophytica]